jgi:PAS domain S-box-containing protein
MGSATDITVFITLLSGILGLISWLWIKIIRPTMSFVHKHDEIAKSVETIKNELTTNGGNSIKDAVCNLGHTCDRIEDGQKIIEQRTKAALHYIPAALFETDGAGRLTWTNEPFYELTGQSLSDMEGFDWLVYIHEDEREDLMTDFESCLEMNRKFSRDVMTSDDKEVRLTGFPYKLSEKEHGGFLVSISEIRSD